MRLPLSTLEVFNAIVKAGSMRGAAQLLGVKRSTISHQLKSLEQEMGVSLFVRSTRSISLTEAGRVLSQTSGPAFEQLAAGLESARTEGHTARGTLKLAMPEIIYHLFVSQYLVSFQRQYPEITLELSVTDAMSDILKEGFHAGFRLGNLITQDMVAISLSKPLTSAVLASPDYLARHGEPEQPMALLQHNCLNYRFQGSGQIAPWRFSGPEGEYSVITKGSLVSNSLPVMLEMAIQGLGIAYTFEDYCSHQIERGELKEVLLEHRVSMPSIHIYFPQEYRSMMLLRLFIQHIKDSQNGVNVDEKNVR